MVLFRQAISQLISQDESKGMVDRITTITNLVISRVLMGTVTRIDGQSPSLLELSLKLIEIEVSSRPNDFEERTSYFLNCRSWRSDTMGRADHPQMLCHGLNESTCPMISKKSGSMNRLNSTHIRLSIPKQHQKHINPQHPNIQPKK